MNNKKNIIDENLIDKLLAHTGESSEQEVRKVLEKASLKKGLTLKETAVLLSAKEGKLIEEIFQMAGKVKEDIYGERLVFFAPLYLTNFCVNDCSYCGFRVSNDIERKTLTLDEVRSETKALIDMGHKRLLLEFGEDPKEAPIGYVIDVIKTIYETKSGNGEIRRVNVNLAATSVDDYKKLKDSAIGTYQLFQETYHKETYAKLHKGPKADYDRQIFALDRAFEAGLDDLGIGVLFGLYDYRFEVLALLSHALYMEENLGVGPHTISVPRFQPAEGADWEKAPHHVSEDELLKIVAVLRLAVPYTGIIMSTRESEIVRRKAFEIGVSQTSAASVTKPGGYDKESNMKVTLNTGQFSTSDKRSVDEILKSILDQNLIPSFCTACYREERTGEAFMEITKDGNIHNLCRPNAILTFQEYLDDYGSEEVRVKGEKLIENYIEQIPSEGIKKETIKRLKRIKEGARDLFF